MFIDGYRFGKMVVQGVEHDSDLLIHCHEVLPRWWRIEGHRLSLKDLEWVLARRPDVLVIGQGYFGRMEVPQALVRQLESRDLGVRAATTRKAVQQYNSLVKEGLDVAGAFHLTC